jgi:ABC-type multidrug transport system fused ATPase/permease subunit
MKLIKSLVKRYLKYFSYFYTHLRYRMLIALAISLAVGTLDGFGLAMFLPLLEMVDGQKNVSADSLGNLRFLVDGIQAMGISLTLVSVLLVMLFFFVLKAVARFVEAFYKVIITRYFIRNLRFENIDKLAGFSYKAFVMADVGRIQNTLSTEVAKLLNAYRSYFMAIQAGVMVVVYVVMAFLANAQFALLVVGGGLLSNLAYQRIYRKTKEGSKKLTKSGHQFHALLIQKVAFFKYLKATGSMKAYSRKLKAVILETEEVTRKMGVYNAILSATKEPLVVLVVIAVIIVQVQYFSQTLGLIILSLLFFYRSLTYLMNVQNNWNSFLTGTGAIENMNEFMQELKINQERSGKEKFTSFQDKIELRNVSFSYGNTSIIDNLNITIRRNETVAFVGESGSGKTTLVNILAGLMPVNSGAFVIDGKNFSAFNASTYQERIGYITQEPVIFSDSIYNNVTFWAVRNPEMKVASGRLYVKLRLTPL